MKENKYDDSAFFEKYGQMSRSKEGLTAAGEWDALKRLLPDFKNKRVLDLGCGYGWHCIYAAENGAESVLGVDISEKMLKVARDKTNFSNVRYVCSSMEDLEMRENYFDAVISSLAFHYVEKESFETIVKKVFAALKPGGNFVFSAEHPVFTAYGSQDWYYDEMGEILHFPVDNYFSEGRRKAVFLGEEVIKYHKTFTTYINTLLQCGYLLNCIVEPQPTQNMLETVPDMKNELRRPMMLIVSASK